MKRVGYITDKDGRRITLLEAMGDYGNVQKAYNKARKCKRHRKDVLIFTKDKEENLDKVREDIINLAYEPSKHELGVEAYIRYMDDFVILSPDKEQLRNWLARIEQFLREELKLEFNPKTTMLAAKNGIDFVGYKHRATHRKVRKDSIKRIKRTIKKCESGKITKEQLQKSIQSWTGHAGHADSYNLRKKIETLAEAAIEKAA